MFVCFSWLGESRRDGDTTINHMGVLVRGVFEMRKAEAAGERGCGGTSGGESTTSIDFGRKKSKVSHRIRNYLLASFIPAN